MTSQPEPKYPRRIHTHHDCPEHQSLVNLMVSARKPVCNSCFETLKKSHYNVIAGLLIGSNWLHHRLESFQASHEQLLRDITELSEAILRIQSELGEHVRNQAPNHHNTPLSAYQKHQAERSLAAPEEKQEPRSDETDRPMAESKRRSRNVSNRQIRRNRRQRKRNRLRGCRLQDDLQHRKGVIDPPGTYTLQPSIPASQDDTHPE